MQTRPFDWRDLPKLHSYRNETLFLNNALLLTRGPLQTLGAMFATVIPSVGICTAVCNGEGEDHQTLIGQVIHNAGETYAYISFLAPESGMTEELFPPLIEHLMGQTGGRGVHRILAEIEERSLALETFRKAGFAVYARQRIWRLPEGGGEQSMRIAWRPANSQDLFAVRMLYTNLVPAMVQQVEPVTLDRPRGLVYYQNGELQAFVELRYGLRGIYARPYVHPELEDATGELMALLLHLPSRRGRAIHVCVSAYQSWMDNILADMGAETTPRLALLVKHLTVKLKQERALAIPGLEAHPETFAFSDLENTKNL